MVVKYKWHLFQPWALPLALFLGYKRNIQNRVQGLDKSQATTVEPRDTIDEIDDPYDLYGEINEQQEFSTQEIKTIINEEKKKAKTKIRLKNTIFFQQQDLPLCIE